MCFWKCIPAVSALVLAGLAVRQSSAWTPADTLAPVTPVYETWSAARTGITWQHENALSHRRYLPESMGPGVAMFDYDNDGWMDLYFVNSGPADFYQPPRPLRNALYHNNHDGTFTDVTQHAGVAGRDFGIGVAAADYDGDGWVDLLVTNYGTNVLYHNNHNGTFTDVTKQAGLAAPGLYTSAVWFDLDNDGKLDLFVGHFVKYNRTLERDCKEKGVPHYCYPLSYDPWPSRLYRNNGDGTFTDISERSGIAAHAGKTFGAVATDVNNDGLLDLFVANDSVPNFLFLNKGQGRFEEIGLEAGVAYSADGAARSGMGVDSADYNNDGLLDLFVANFNREKFSLYRNRGGLTFDDQAGPTGIGMATHMYSGWGLHFYDFDQDGQLDLIVCNGHPDDLIESISTTLQYREPILLFRNTGKGFENWRDRAGEAFQQRYPARGLAVGDLDNDGRPDIVIGNNGAAPLVLHHRGTRHHWIGLGGLPPGAWLRWSAGGVERSRLVTAGGSYLSSQDPRQLIGLANADRLDWLEVRWPAPRAATERWEQLFADRYYQLAPGAKPR